jgi:MtN3 and saliva related transmembrane protein
MIADLVGYVAGSLMSIVSVPQIIKSLKTKSVKDLSFLTLALLVIGSTLWMVYGFLITSWPVIIMDLIAIFINLFLLIIKIKYEHS